MIYILKTKVIKKIKSTVPSAHKHQLYPSLLFFILHDNKPYLPWYSQIAQTAESALSPQCTLRKPTVF